MVEKAEGYRNDGVEDMGRHDHRIEMEELDHHYGNNHVLRSLSLRIEPGEMVGLLGPNGSGKTTLLRCVSGQLDFDSGRVRVGDMDVRRGDTRELARVVGTVPQETPMDFEFTVEEVVLMGRYPHIDRFRLEDSSDFEVARRAMRLTKTLGLCRRQVTHLSGGEKQRVVIARTLAQEPRILLLDEPTSHLDIGHQLEILELITRLNREGGLTVISVFHDLNLASKFCQRLLLMREGAIMADGAPAEVLTTGNIRKAFGVTCGIERTDDGNVLVEVEELSRDRLDVAGRLR